MYHPNSPYGKLNKILNNDECICGNTKQRFKPFCFDCFDELKDKDFPITQLYKEGEKGLEGMISAIEVLGFKLK